MTFGFEVDLEEADTMILGGITGDTAGVLSPGRVYIIVFCVIPVHIYEFFV